MAGLVNASRNSMLDQLGTLAAYVSLHSADPGTGGTNELTGGSPAYARKAMTWNSAASSSKTGPTGTITFDVPGGSTVAYLGYWSAVTAGTFYGSRALSASETFTGQGQYQLAAAAVSESLT